MWEATYTSLFLFILSYGFISSYQYNYISSSLYRFNYTSHTPLFTHIHSPNITLLNQ